MIGGGVPKNFIQDTVICAELLGKEVDMHKYAFKSLLQIQEMVLVVAQL
jgi:deoxyhypusine synthase